MSKKVAQVVRTKEQSKAGLKKKVRMFYDLQRLRMQTKGRTQEKGKKPDSEEKVEIELHEVDQAILDSRAEDLHKAEKLALKDVEHHLKSEPLWNQVLSDKTRFKGLGPTMAGVIMAENDIYRQDTASKLWAFSGLAPEKAWRCTVCNQLVEPNGPEETVFHHTVWRKKTDDTKSKKPKCPDPVPRQQAYPSGKSMRPKKGEKLKYNAFLRSKIIGVMGPCLLKANSPMRKYYDDYKHRLETMGKGVSDGHRHNMAIRYMCKMVLLEIWKEWRALEGLPVRDSYFEEKRGHKHGEEMPRTT